MVRDGARARATRVQACGTEEELTSLRDGMNDAEEWLYGDGAAAKARACRRAAAVRGGRRASYAVGVWCFPQLTEYHARLNKMAKVMKARARGRTAAAARAACG